MKTTTEHRRYFQPYLVWALAAVLVALVLSRGTLPAQVLHRPPTAAELAQWAEMRAAAKAKAKAEKHARFAPVRAALARARVFQIRARLVKLDHRVDGWENEVPSLKRRLRDLDRAPRGNRRSTGRRNLSSIVADVKRKLAQREKWIKDARAEQNRLLVEREACYATIEEARITKATRKRR